MESQVAVILGCTVTTHDYQELIGKRVSVYDEDFLYEGEWAIVFYDGAPYFISKLDLEILESEE